MGKSPTVRQKIAAKKSADAILLGRPVSKAKILKEAGYSNKITRDPDRVFDTEGFRQALNEYLPLDRVSEVHKQLLENARDSVQMQAVKTTLAMPGTKGCSQALHNEKQPSHDGDFSSADLQACLSPACR